MIGKEGVLEIGSNVFFNNDCSINCLERIEIGDDCLFGEGVRIYDHDHRFRDCCTPIVDQGFISGSVSVGSGTWVGSNVVILRGSSVGKNCVIGAGCIIHGNIPDGSLVKPSNSYQQIVRSGFVSVE